MIGHQQIWFDDGSSVGFGKEGRFGEPEGRKSNYGRCKDGYDDDIMRQAINNLDPPADGSYSLLGNNCQHWADRVVDEYRRLMP